MIVNKVLNNAVLFPKKPAIIYGDKKISYVELSIAVDKACKRPLSKTAIHYIQNTNPIETIVEILALNSNGAKGVVLPPYFDSSVLEDKESTKDSFIGILTSGSSGKERIIWKSNDNWELAFNHQSEVFGVNKSDTVFVVDALSYSANLNAALHILWSGGTLVVDSLKNAKNWGQVFKANDVTSSFLVPSHCRLLSKLDFSGVALKSLITAGEKLDIKTAQDILSQFPKVKLTEYYGAAELGHITYHQNEDIINYPLSVGKPFPGVTVSVVEDKVSVKSLYVSSSYKKIATVNDLGYFDEKRLVLKGRAGRFFNRRAVNIYAQEIEQVALKLASIKQAILVKGEKVDKLTLYFTSHDPFDNAEFELFEFLKANLPASKIPNFVREIDQIPHSNAGKIDFKALSKMSNEDTVLM